MGLPAGMNREKIREKVSGMFVIYLCIPLVLIKGPKSISSDLSNLLKYILVHLTIIFVSTSASSIGGAQIRSQMFQNSSSQIKGFVTTVILQVPKRIYSK